MKHRTTGISKDNSKGPGALKNAARVTRLQSSLQQYLPVRLSVRMLLLLLACSACGNKDHGATERPDIKFDKVKWSLKHDGAYTYRKQMVADLLHNYQWAGLPKDSVIRKLGQPDKFEAAEALLIYYYETTSALGGLATKIEAVNFELGPDSMVKEARLNDGLQLPGGSHWD